MPSIQDFALQQKLHIREKENSLRKLVNYNGLYDFSSNDYLGFARSEEIRAKIHRTLQEHPDEPLGSTGSRLLTGNSVYAEQLEIELAKIHHCEASLLFNSGYTANLALFSSLPQRNDTVIYDEYIHASVIDGMRLSHGKRLKFRHNSPGDLIQKLRLSSGACFVAIESIYSMDGDLAELAAIASVCREHGAHLIVDEAHAFGVLGTGMVDTLNLHHEVYARVVTFGKALGLHGAVVLGSQTLKEYLINFARPFIYTTAPPFQQILPIQVAYKHLISNPGLSISLKEKSSLLKAHLPQNSNHSIRNNSSPIQCILIPGNDQVLSRSKALREAGYDVRAIRSPSVPPGLERLRITVHLHNSDEEIIALGSHLQKL